MAEQEKLIRQIVDEPTGEVIEVTDDMRKWAFQIHNYMEADTFIKAFIWTIFRAQRLYLAFGCSSMAEYAEKNTSVGRSTVYSYLDIGGKFFSAIKEVKSLTVRLEDPPEEFLKELQSDPDIAEVGKLGHRKLREIGKQGDERIKQLFEQKEITFDDGTTITVDDIKKQTARDFERQLKERREYNKDLELELNKTAKERDEALAEKEKAEREAEVGRKYRDVFGKESQDFELFKSRISTAKEKASELNQVLSKIKDMPADFESLIDDLRSLHQQIDRGLTKLRDENRESGAFASRSAAPQSSKVKGL